MSTVSRWMRKTVRDVRRDAVSDLGSFDDDLEWILDRLSERSGARFAMIVRFGIDRSHPEVLARSSGDMDLHGAALDRLCQAIAPPVRGFSRSDTDEHLHKLSLDLRPCGSDPVRVLSLSFAPAEGVLLVVTICRPESSFNLLHEMVARRLQPVLARYLKLWWMHRTERRRAILYEGTIDELEMGVVMLDAQGSLRYANRTASRLLAERDGLQRLDQGVAPSGGNSPCVLNKAIAAIESMPDSPSVLLSLARTRKRPLIVTVVRAQGRCIESGDVTVILYLVDPEQDVGALLKPALRMYRLTATEARLVTLLVSGVELSTAASTLNLALHTARSYLKQVFVKTGTHRQAELVRVMCSSAARSSIAADLTLL